MAIRSVILKSGSQARHSAKPLSDHANFLLLGITITTKYASSAQGYGFKYLRSMVDQLGSRIEEVLIVGQV